MRLIGAIFLAATLAGWPGPGKPFAVAEEAKGGIDPALLKRAEGGDVNAQMKLGKQLVKGISVPRDLKATEKWFNRATAQRPKRAFSVGMTYRREKAYQQARKWLRRAAELKIRTAYIILAHMYRNGEGSAPDYEKAETYLRLAAEAGNEAAWGSIGELYYQGKGRPRDFDKAREYFRRASGYVFSAIRLAGMYFHGLGGPRDPEAAVKLYEKAAARPNREAMHLLGTLYRNGQLPGPGEQSKALTWFLLATAFGHAEAEILVRRIDVRISRFVALAATARARSIAGEAKFNPDILAYLDQAERYFRK
jgi:TPR repeat protein